MKRIILTIVSLMLVCVSYAKPVKGRVQCDGKGVAGVVVSDGFSTVLTDSKGRFHFIFHRCVAGMTVTGGASKTAGNAMISL